MSAPVRPRRVAHRGSVIACGCAFDVAALGVAEARRRALALWVPGARVLAADGVIAVTGLPPHRVRAEHAPGAPLVEQGGVVATAPLTDDERAALPAGAAVVVRGGVAEVIGGERAVDVAAWLALGEVTLIATDALAAPPPVAVAPPPPAIDLRAAVGLAAQAEGAAGFAAALARAEAGGAGAAGVAGAAAAGGPADDDAPAAARPSRWQRLLGWLGARLTRPAPIAGDGVSSSWPRAAPGGSGGSGTAIARTPAPPSWWARLRARLAEAAWRSRLGEALGRRHAEYLRRMLEMFDQGDLDQALRHAIPLGGGDDGPRQLGLSPPRPRADVALSMAPRHGGASLPVGLSAADAIRARYRQALDRLVREGRVEEAAFVLADLLGDVEGAVALLEQHRRFALAARLAEGHGLAPGLVVRLWWLGGDRARAVAVARRHQAWADALTRLERAGDRDAARVLRLTWADHAATTGDYGLAVKLAVGIAAARALVLAWIERGLAVGGSGAGRLLITKLTLAPERFAEVAPAVAAILADLDDDAVAARRVLAEAMLEAPAGPALATLARATVRALARDVGRGVDGDAPALLPRLVRVADDAALRTDLPPLRMGPRPAALVDRPTAWARRWSAGDVGALPVHDAALLPDGRLLLALGELGVRLLRKGGSRVATFDPPTTALVVADHGGRALATIRRGGYLRIAQLDLATHRSRWWCDAECDGGVDTYDGDVWLTTRKGEVLAIDTTATRWTATWGVDTEQPACAITRDGDRFAVDARDFGASQAWFYDRFVLRQRTELTDDVLGVDPVMLTLRPGPQDWIGAAYRDGAGGAPRGWEVRWPGGALALPEGALQALTADARFVATVARGAAGVIVSIVYLARPAVIATLYLDGAATARVRLTDLCAVVCDDRGRVIVVDLRTGEVPSDLRIGP
ncbi:MAG: hypothetical protein JNK64_31850 [Myxococcales bacterium]|nr:hypothetical protein [Myxococcales bacterium]